ncbi:MAG: transcriptional regulator [Chlorobium sp.]|nr:MAG: transcriptional regulator [Chlorobium sp.]
MESPIRPILATTKKNHWKSHHPGAGYSKWMSVIDDNIVHTWVEVEEKHDIILDFMDVDLLQVVLSESDLINKQFHILFDLAHISSISFNYKLAITDLFFNWSPMLGVIGFYNIPESMRIIVETFAAVAPEKVCVILADTYKDSIEKVIAFKAGTLATGNCGSENNHPEPAIKKRFLEAIARISWLNMLDEQITTPPPGNPYYPFFMAIDSLRSDLIAKEIKKKSEIHLLQQNFESRIIQMVIKTNAQAEVNKKSTRDMQNEITNLTRKIETQNMELAKISKAIADSKNGFRHLLEKIESLDIDPNLKQEMANSCRSLIENKVLEKQPDIEMTESDLLFLSKLQTKFPHLNQRELKISLLVKLNYDTADIARSIGLSTRGMESIRYRMHKKLGLGKHQSIKSYLSELAG